MPIASVNNIDISYTIPAARQLIILAHGGWRSKNLLTGGGDAEIVVPGGGPRLRFYSFEGYPTKGRSLAVEILQNPAVAFDGIPNYASTTETFNPGAIVKDYALYNMDDQPAIGTIIWPGHCSGVGPYYHRDVDLAIIQTQHKRHLSEVLALARTFGTHHEIIHCAFCRVARKSMSY